MHTVVSISLLGLVLIASGVLFFYALNAESMPNIQQESESFTGNIETLKAEIGDSLTSIHVRTSQQPNQIHGRIIAE